MDPNTKKKLIGAIIAAALAVAVYYGLIDQKQADSIRTQGDQTLGTGSAPQPAPQQTQPAPQPQPDATTPRNTMPAPAAPASQNPAPTPQ